ncbi:hypothetical protein BSKO_07247 [Bryopsis sp. KO-2023]|nr:hypothetical protein BSKO_07247 [Bryopsis sp. KO-2023]
MHGRPRPPKDFSPPPEVVAAQERKTKLLRNATSEVLKRRREKDYSDESLGLAAKLLSLNPEVYTVWNFRREALQKVFIDKEKSVDEKRAISEKELQVSAEALKRNPKSYSAWHQRRWVVEKGYTVPRHELLFVEARLEEDERNFHAWNYRQFLAAHAGRSPEEELEFSRKKIDQNFSNFSAWHYRTKFLPLVGRAKGTTTLTQLVEEENKTPKAGIGVGGDLVPVEMLEEEYEIVHSAFVTDSQDSSSWFYYRWLLGHSIAHCTRPMPTEEKSNAVRRLLEFIDGEKTKLETEHLSVEPDAKWPCLAVAWLEEIVAHFADDGGGGGGNSGGKVVKDIFAKLMGLDVQRKGFYRHAMNGETSLVISS